MLEYLTKVLYDFTNYTSHKLLGENQTLTFMHWAKVIRLK